MELTQKSSSKQSINYVRKTYIPFTIFIHKITWLDLLKKSLSLPKYEDKTLNSMTQTNTMSRANFGKYEGAMVFHVFNKIFFCG